jgi:2-keto-4-pentenoate hydratase/2-oxohepta-3-ene-1,7-dioic acid hydratase in catechol pathway
MRQQGKTNGSTLVQGGGVKIAVFRQGGGRRVGVVDAAARQIAPLRLDSAAAETGALAVIEGALRGEPLPAREPPIPLGTAALEAPLPRPRRNIFCVGKNYFDHAHEFARSGFDSSAAAGAVPEAPIIFSKVPECVSPPGALIPVDAGVSRAVDYEAELGVIIGRGGRGIRREQAMAHVWGYTIVNDVTARDLQGRHKQWLIGKSQDGFCPMGPWAVTADEIDLADTWVSCWVNGERRQHANTRDLIFDVPTLIETISAGITLLPGDIIATGTPAGVGIGFDPPKYLEPGDVVRIEIDGIGSLENPVAAHPAAAAAGARAKVGA